jgi:hypothetical protein
MQDSIAGPAGSITLFLGTPSPSMRFKSMHLQNWISLVKRGREHHGSRFDTAPTVVCVDIRAFRAEFNQPATDPQIVLAGPC